MTEAAGGRLSPPNGTAAGAAPRRSALALLRPIRRLFALIGVGRWLAFGFLAGLLVLRVWDPFPVEILRLKVFDFYQSFEPRAISPQPVVIVDVDETSLARHGQWPWPRTLIADLVTQLGNFGVVAIGFDVVFPEPDRASPDQVANSLRGVDESIRAELLGLPGNDDSLADAFRKGRVVVGQAGYPKPVGGDRPLPHMPLATMGDDPRPFLLRFQGIVRNIPVLEEAAAGQGMFSINPERDGVVRRVPAIVRFGDEILPTLALELLRIATGGQALVIKTDEAGVRSLVVGGVEIPTDRQGRLWVNYSQHDPTKYIAAKDVLDGTAPFEKLSGRLVLIGTSATGLLDIKTTPVEAAMPGVEVHAQLLETILSGTQLVRPNYAIGAELVTAATVGLLVIVLVPIMGAIWTLALGGTLAAVLTAGSWYLYVEKGLLIDISYALLASLVIYGSLVYFNYFREEAQRRQVRSAFGQYLSPALVKQLADDPDRLVLGGEAKVMTFLFCDVRGFTTISEQFRDNPQGLTALINRFLTPLSDAILAYNGTIDKYMGDCIMAFWNAPLNDPAHAANACEAALAMVGNLQGLNVQRRAEAEAADEPFYDLQVGVGINTGACTVGNMGTAQRFDYSVLGDAVNLASRLEGQSKTYGVTIVIGEDTAAEIGDRFACLELDLIAVKGKTEPARIFALMGDAGRAADPDFVALAERNDALIRHYRAQAWGEARAALADCRARGADLGLATFYDLYEARIAAFEADPPPSDWDGVTVALTK